MEKQFKYFLEYIYISSSDIEQVFINTGRLPETHILVVRPYIRREKESICISRSRSLNILPLCIADQVGQIPEGHPSLKENQLLTSSLRALGYSSPICTLSVLQEVWLFVLEAKSVPQDPFFLSAETRDVRIMTRTE